MKQSPARLTVLLALSALVLACSTKAEKSPGAATAGGGAESSAPTKIRVTGIPDENPTDVARQHRPLVARLEAALGVPVEYLPVTDYGAAVQALAAGKVDFAWLGGFTYVQARNMAKVVPLVMRDIDREFHSVFIASAQSGIEKAADMKGKTFAFGSKSSTSGHLMPRHYLQQEFGLDAATDFAGPPVYSGAHDATVKLVESGKVAAGAVNMQVWERMVREGQVDTGKVKLVWKTPPYVDYVWAARGDLPAGVRKKFSDVFLGLDGAREADRALLDRMGASKYVPAAASDFDAIESVGRATGLLK